MVAVKRRSHNTILWQPEWFSYVKRVTSGSVGGCRNPHMLLTSLALENLLSMGRKQCGWLKSIEHGQEVYGLCIVYVGTGIRYVYTVVYCRALCYSHVVDVGRRGGENL